MTSLSPKSRVKREISTWIWQLFTQLVDTLHTPNLFLFFLFLRTTFSSLYTERMREILEKFLSLPTRQYECVLSSLRWSFFPIIRKSFPLFSASLRLGEMKACALLSQQNNPGEFPYYHNMDSNANDDDDTQWIPSFALDRKIWETREKRVESAQPNFQCVRRDAESGRWVKSGFHVVRVSLHTRKSSHDSLLSRGPTWTVFIVSIFSLENVHSEKVTKEGKKMWKICHGQKRLRSPRA